MKELELIAEILSSSKMFVESNGRVLSDKLLWDVLPFLKNVPKNETKDEDKDKNNISVAGTEWDEIGLLSELFDSNNNSSTNSEQPIDEPGLTNSELTIDEPNDTTGGEPLVDASALTNNDIDEDEQDNDRIILNHNVTIGLAGYCSRNIAIKKLPLAMKYKGDCHMYASDLLKKKNYINTRLHAHQRNRRERRVLNDSLFAYISNIAML